MEQEYFGNSLFTWLIVAGIIAGGVILGWILARILAWMGRRSSSAFLEEMLRTMGRFMPGFSLLLFIQIGLQFLTLEEEPASFLDRSLAFGFSILVVFLILRIYHGFHQTVLVPMAERSETEVDDHLIEILRMVVRVLVITLGILVALSNAGFDVRAVLAGLGIGSLAFALAAQDAVANLFGGVTVLIEKPFKIGDLIEVNEIEGYVKKIDLRTTTLEATTGRIIRLPNKVFTENAIHLITHTESLVRVERELLLRYNTSAEQLQKAVELIASIVEQEEETALQECGFQAFGEYGFQLSFAYDIRLWTEDQEGTYATPRQKRAQVNTRINLAIMQQFQEAKIYLALPLGEEIGIEGEERDFSGVF